MSKTIKLVSDRKRKITPFHVGILVADIQEAIKNFTNVLGVRFGPIQDMTLNAHGGTEGEIKMKVAYSMEGPVYIELIEGTERNGFFSLKNGEGLHHLGVWSEDYSSYLERDAEGKLPVRMKMNIMPGDPTYWFSDPSDLHGTRIEFMNSGMRRGIEAWINGEDLS